ncbi:MAG: efflux RND transporter permease subunit [Deltaproteobacteria bacterium]|nr:efflux RND transporter permease subunit [Deltaproteobacteria bacterium]
MLQSIIRFALTQRMMALILIISLSIVGVWSFLTLPIDAYPDISTTQVQVIVKAQGMTPLEVEKRITQPVEMAVKGIPNQTIVRSITKYALSVVTIDFTDDTDIYWARQQVNERIAQILASLPDGVEGGLAPIASPLSEVFMFLVEGKNYTNTELREVLDWMIRPRLVGVDGVADVNALGGFVKSYQVEPRPDDLFALKISFEEVVESIRKNNANVGGDRIIINDEVVLVRTEGLVRNVNDLNRIIVRNVKGRTIRIQDVADVKVGSVTRYGGVTANGRGEAVQGLVLLRRGANGRATVEGVKSALRTIEKSLPAGVKIVPFYDRTELISKAVWTVESSLGQAIILVLIVLLLFLGNVRAAITAGLILPSAVLSSFILMKYFGITANLMSLGGLAISIGILVDSSVVVVENIHNFLSDKSNKAHKLNLIYRAVSEVAAPVLTAVIIIIVSFLPIFILTGIEGKLFTPLAFTITFALLSSVFLSLTVIPVISSFVMKGATDKDTFLVRFLLRGYNRSLGWVLKYSKLSILAGTILAVVSFSLFPFIGSEFLPQLDEGTIVVQTEKIPSISLVKSLEMDAEIQKALMELPEITGVVSRTGSDELRLDPMGFYQSDNYLVTLPREKWKAKSVEELQDKIRKKLEQFPGLNFGFTQPIDMRVSEMLTGVKAALGVKLFGDDMAILEARAIKIEEIIKSIPGATDVIRTPLGGQKYLKIDMNRKAMDCQGISVSAINDIIARAVGGSEISEVIEGSRKFPITVRFPERYRDSINSIENILVDTSRGGKIRLGDLARVKIVDGPIQITREGGKRLVSIQSNVRGRDIVGFVAELRSKMSSNLNLPPGYFVEYGGQFENQQRASRRIMFAIPAAFLIIFLILFSIFKTVRQAMVILFNIPLALIGGVVLLFFSGFYLSVPASLGFIALFGLAIENSVVMISFYNQLRQGGLTLEESVREGSARRLRPVLMTAILTMLGLIPLLISTGPGSEIQKPLAVVVFGGVFSSTILTLLLLPTVYYVVEKAALRRDNKLREEQKDYESSKVCSE